MAGASVRVAKTCQGQQGGHEMVVEHSERGMDFGFRPNANAHGLKGRAAYQTGMLVSKWRARVRPEARDVAAQEGDKEVAFITGHGLTYCRLVVLHPQMHAGRVVVVQLLNEQKRVNSGYRVSFALEASRGGEKAFFFASHLHNARFAPRSKVDPSLRPEAPALAMDIIFPGIARGAICLDAFQRLSLGCDTRRPPFVILGSEISALR